MFPSTVGFLGTSTWKVAQNTGAMGDVAAFAIGEAVGRLPSVINGAGD